MIRFFNVTKRYANGVEALRGLKLHVPASSFLYLTGPSGAGKTTFLKLLLGIERASEGEILIAGRNLKMLEDRSIPLLRRSIGIVFQDFKLLADRNVFENVAIGLEIRGHPPRDIRRRVAEVLDSLGILRYQRAYPEMLSGGEQQRVAIARAVVTEPPILLADEPTGNLDPSMSLEIARIFEEIHKKGTTVLVATHDPSLPETYPHRVVTLNKGYLVMDTDPQKVPDDLPDLDGAFR
jgi:cell division transport system ATP-binding protein